MRKNDPAVPNNEMMSKGRRPYLSERIPINGVERNSQIEYMENRMPSAKADSPYLDEYIYRIGITMPYPSAFMRVMKETTKRRLLYLNMGDHFFH
jgi:hypothetical protein